MLINKNKLLNALQTPDPEEKLLFSKALDQAFLCLNKHQQTFTGFLNPIAATKFGKIIGENADLNVLIYGGAQGCERCILGFSPSYLELLEGDFPIEGIEFLFSPEYGKDLSHRDFLGAIIGAGIDRSKIGDLFLFQSRAIAFVHQENADFLCQSIDKVNRTGVKVQLADRDYLSAPLLDFKQMDITVSSLRIDTVISEVFNVPRGKATKLIGSGKAFINWSAVKSPSKAVTDKDVLTLRGYGRAVIEDITMNRKKDTIHLSVKKTT